MTGVSIRIEGERQVAGRLAATARQLAAPQRLWEKVGDALVLSTQQRFDRGVGPEGGAWPPSIRAKLTGGRTLVDSTRLRNSIVREAGPTGVAVGTNAIYAAVHQFGATIRPVKASRLHFVIGGRHVFANQVRIPARPFLGLDNADRQELVEIAEEFMATSLGGADARR